MKTFLICILASCTLFVSACNKDKIPGVYRIDIQQGNDVTQDMINQLKPDMTKNQVTYIMGTPLLIDTFHPNRWDYIYSFHPGNGSREQRRITLFFENGLLDYVEGDTRTVAREDLPQSNKESANVIVPLTKKKTGFFRGLLNTIGLGETEPDVITDEIEKEALVPATDEALEETEQSLEEAL
ncbi:MAG: outer membrane protein assembly factor BamE [Methylophaga sp.]|nr:outer membrane protein assembly factor BamE [Methylophaga sp.]